MKQNLTPHSLRRGAAHHLNDKRVPLEQIQMITRHDTEPLRQLPMRTDEAAPQTLGPPRRMQEKPTRTTLRRHLDTLVSLDKENELEDILQIIRKRETFVSHLKEGWDKQAGIRRGTSRHMDQHLDTLIDFGVLSRTSASPQEVILHAFTVEKKSGSLRFVDGRKLKRSRGPPPQMSKKTITFNSSLFFGVNTAGDRRMTWVAYQLNKI